MNVNTENLQDMNNIRDKIRWEGVWKWLKEAFRQIKLGDDGWMKTHVSVLLDMDLLWNYFPSKERPWCIYATAVLRNLWRLYKEGQSLLIKTVEINPMTLLPDSHLPYIPFMNQVFLPEDIVY